MKKTRFVLSILIHFSSLQVLAQEKKAIHDDYRNIAITSNYFGELLLHPGLTIGLEYHLKNKKYTQYHLNVEVGGYYHKRNQNGYMLNGSFGVKFFISKTAFIDMNLGVGYLHTFPQGDIYTSTSSGVKKTTNYGDGHFRPSLVLISGWDKSRKGILPISFNWGVDIAMESSVNSTYIPHLALRLGIIYRLLNQENSKTK